MEKNSEKEGKNRGNLYLVLFVTGVIVLLTVIKMLI